MCHLFKSLLEFSSKKLNCYCHKKIDIIKCDSKANHCASKECWKRINGCWAKCPFFVLYSNCRPPNAILVMKFSATFLYDIRLFPSNFSYWKDFKVFVQIFNFHFHFNSIFVWYKIISIPKMPKFWSTFSSSISRFLLKKKKLLLSKMSGFCALFKLLPS